MTHLIRRATGASALALAITMAPAAAADTGNHPKPERAAKPAKPPKPKNTMIVCNHSGYLIGVYAMGPGQVRRSDLAGSYDECVTWKHLRPGFHDTGFNWRVPSQQNVALELRVKYDGHTVYKRVFPGSGALLQLAGDKTMKVDFYIPRG